MRRALTSSGWRLALYLALLPLGVGRSAHAAQGEFVYVNNLTGPNSISAFSVSPDGVLSEVAGSPFLTGGFSVPISGSQPSIAVCAKPALLFALNWDSGDVSAFRIDPADGSLSLVPGSPFQVQGAARLLAVTPDCRFLMVDTAIGSLSARDITVFDVSSSGALNPTPDSPFRVE